MQENNGTANPSASLIHRLDPRTKLAGLLMSFAIVLLPERPAVVGAGALLVLALVIWARAWRELARLRWLLLGLAVFSIGLWSVLAQGPTPLIGRISQESLAFGVATFLKLAAMMAAGLVLLAATRVEELFIGLVKLRLPYPVAFAFTLALRWVPEIFATAQRVKEAQEVRGLEVHAGSPWRRLREHLPLLVPIFLLTLRRSQTMAWALESRGFQKSRERTYLSDIRMTPRDWLALAVALAVLALFITLHVLHLDRIPGLILP
jgi:energy-coupling factor transport system permease protein